MESQNAFWNGCHRALGHPWWHGLILAVLRWALTVPGVAAANDLLETESSPLRLDVTLCDNYKLFQSGFELMAEEVSATFGEIGLETRFRRYSDEMPKPEAVHVMVTLMPNTATDWGVPKRITGVSLVTGTARSVYIFLPKLFDTLGWTWNPNHTRSARQNVELARALGRVIAHELVHAIAPQAPHTESGLMSAWLNRGSLLRGQLRMSASTAEHVLAAMKTALSSSGENGIPVTTGPDMLD